MCVVELNLAGTVTRDAARRMRKPRTRGPKADSSEAISRLETDLATGEEGGGGRGEGRAGRREACEVSIVNQAARAAFVARENHTRAPADLAFHRDCFLVGKPRPWRIAAVARGEAEIKIPAGR